MNRQIDLQADFGGYQSIGSLSKIADSALQEADLKRIGSTSASVRRGRQNEQGAFDTSGLRRPVLFHSGARASRDSHTVPAVRSRLLVLIKIRRFNNTKKQP